MTVAIDNNGNFITKEQYDAMTPRERSLYLIYVRGNTPLFKYMGVDDDSLCYTEGE